MQTKFKKCFVPTAAPKYAVLRRSRIAAFIAISTMCALITGTAHAATYLMEFEATGFAPYDGDDPPPMDPVTGSIVFESADLASDVTSIDAVNLTIGGHTYLTDEVGSINLNSPGDPAGKYLFGGLLDGVDGIRTGTDDFWVASFSTGLVSYSTFGGSTLWSTHDTLVRISAVPEPATQALMLVGVAALAVTSRARRS